MTLEEYLVSLGWKVDEPSFKKFLGALSATSARTAELSSVVLETAAAIELMVTRVARKYETLYYVAQRTGQSVKYIQSTQFAFKQIGLSAEEATASIESIGHALRTQPWLRAIFGNANTPQQVASRLGKSGMPYFLQARFAEMIGMDEKTLFHLQRFGEVESAAQERFAQRQRAAGLDPDDLARKSADFGRELNNLEGSLEIFGDRMAADFLGPVKTAIMYLTQAVEWLSRVDSATHGWIITLGTLAGTAGGLLLIEKILRRLLGLNKATFAGRILGGSAAGVGSAFSGGWVGAALGVMGLIKSNDPETKKSLQEALGPLFYELGLSKSPDLVGDKSVGGTPAGAGQDRVKQAVEFFKSKGYSAASAQGIAAGLYSESRMDPNSVNEIGMSGIGQWDTQRRKKFAEMFGHDIRQSSFEEQLQYVLWELANGDPQARAAGQALAKGGMSARQAAGTFIHLFERPGAGGELSDMSRAGPLADALSGLTAQQNVGGDTNVTINQKVTNNVTGAGDPWQTGAAIKAAHDSANDGLVRNFQQVVR